MKIIFKSEINLRTIIAGSRNCNNYDDLLNAIEEIGWCPSVVISGTANGVDEMGERWAIEHDIPLEKYPAQWEKYGKQAGYLRNKQMAENAEALLALWNGKSKGTKHMIDIAFNKNLKIFIQMV